MQSAERHVVRHAWFAVAAIAVLASVSGGRPTAADPLSGVAGVVAGLGSEREECAFLASMCRAALMSIARANSVPPSADFLATRQDLVADAQVRNAVDTAATIERKHGRRLACFDQGACPAVLPPGPARPPADDHR